MPTPIPTIAPIVVANSGIDRTFDRTTVSAMPTPTPATATASGSPMAITDPNATISTTMAKARPMNSDCGGSNSLRASPPSSTCSPGTSGMTRMNSVPRADVSLKSRSGARSIRANATRPSALTCGTPGRVRQARCVLRRGLGDGNHHQIRAGHRHALVRLNCPEHLLHGGPHGGVVPRRTRRRRRSSRSSRRRRRRSAPRAPRSRGGYPTPAPGTPPGTTGP